MITVKSSYKLSSVFISDDVIVYSKIISNEKNIQ